MKRKTAFIMAVLMLALLFTAAACTKNGPDPDRLCRPYLEANTKEALLARHKVFRTDFTEFLGGEISETLFYYLDGDRAMWNFSTGRNNYYAHDLSLDIGVKDGTPRFYSHLSEEDDLYESWLDWAKANEYIALFSADRVIEAADDGNGTFTGVFEFSDPEKVARNIEENAPDYPDGLAYEEGLTIRYEVYFSTETKDLLGYETFLVRGGSEPELVNRALYSYDGERLDPFADGQPYADYRAALNDPAKRRTITAVYRPGAEDEAVKEFVLPRHAGFFLYSRDGLVENALIFTDRACTERYDEKSDDGVSDLTLYLPEAAALK